MDQKVISMITLLWIYTSYWRRYLIEHLMFFWRLPISPASLSLTLSFISLRSYFLFLSHFSILRAPTVTRFLLASSPILFSLTFRFHGFHLRSPNKSAGVLMV
jgi:hypothetical protein